MNPLALVIGPLFVPECRRSSRRGWLLLTRAATGLFLGLPFLVVLWWWWVRVEIDPNFRSNSVVPIGLSVTVVISLLLALLISPAMLAGSLAGERERGSIGLLLSTRVDAREIVLGRLLGKLSVVAGMLMSGWPFVIGFAAIGDVGFLVTICLLLLPFAVGFGVGGLAIGASSVSRKGWSALMGLYFAEMILLLLPLIQLIPGTKPIEGFLNLFNPFDSIEPAIMSGSALPVLGVITTWTLIGLLGAAFASWRLRPSFLALVGGKGIGQSRRWKVPPLEESPPMLWKELHIERGAALGWFGRILGMILFVYLAGGSLMLLIGSLVFWAWPSTPKGLDNMIVLAGKMYSDPGPVFAFLIQLAVGLRAAVAISSERERSTWDALLTSPLSGREILVGKLWGSLFRLRWLLLAILFSWTVSLGLGAMRIREFIGLILQTVLLSVYAAAVGVRASLSQATATRAMSLTVGVIVVTLIVSSIVIVISTGTIILGFLMLWMILSPLGIATSGVRGWVPIQHFGLFWSIQMILVYLSFTLMIVTESWKRFDTLSGRGGSQDIKSKKAVLPELSSSPAMNETDPPGLLREVERVGG